MRSDDSQDRRSVDVVRPEGAPTWITARMIGNTIETWQPYYAKPLTEEDAVGILIAVDRLATALGEQDGEAVSGSGSRLKQRARA